MPREHLSKKLSLKPVLRVCSLFVWGTGSLFAMGSCFYLLLGGDISFFPAIVERNLNYAAYAALPDGGVVLGHFVAAQDSRKLILQDYLAARNSPLSPYSEDFINAADEFQLPWTLLPAIAGKESGFGKAIPKDSFNPFGWGVFTGAQSGVNFDSWEDAIYSVARGLKENYFDRGLTTPAEIEPYYTPPSPGKGHPWLNDVEFFMEQIENWKP